MTGPAWRATRAALMAIAAIAGAAGATAEPAPSPSAGQVARPGEATSSKQPSVYVRCDGAPNDMSAGETVARAVALSLVVGLLAPQHEQGDVSKRFKGMDGVAACDIAIAAETNEVRKTKLRLARAIHLIEAMQYDAAIAEARSVADAAGGRRVFVDSFGVSALEIVAAAQVRAGRIADAQASALAMVALAPWDVVNLQHAGRFIVLGGAVTPASRSYYDRVVRLLPAMVATRADARRWAGDYAGAATDEALLAAMLNVFHSPEKASTPVSSPGLFALQSVDLAFSGDGTRSDALAGQVRAGIETLLHGPEATAKEHDIASAEELLDFRAIQRDAAAGRLKEARSAFAARSRWPTPAPYVAALTAMLRQGAVPTELTGALARDPDALRAEALAARASALTAGDGADKLLWGAIRPYVPANADTGLYRSVWRGEKAKLVRTIPKGVDGQPAEVASLPTATGADGGELLLLNCALVARDRGKPGFVLFPIRQRTNLSIVAFEGPDHAPLPDGVMIKADELVAALTPVFPPPAPGS